MTILMASNFSLKCSSGDSKDPTSCFYLMLIKMNKKPFGLPVFSDLKTDLNHFQIFNFHLPMQLCIKLIPTIIFFLQ
jgi:MFS superfamily sulfate permease-like transporter